jgi:hypothetical protein
MSESFFRSERAVWKLLSKVRFSSQRLPPSFYQVLQSSCNTGPLSVSILTLHTATSSNNTTRPSGHLLSGFAWAFQGLALVYIPALQLGHCEQRDIPVTIWKRNADGLVHAPFDYVLFARQSSLQYPPSSGQTYFTPSSMSLPNSFGSVRICFVRSLNLADMKSSILSQLYWRMVWRVLPSDEWNIR